MLQVDALLIHVYLLRTKDDAFDKFKEYKYVVQNEKRKEKKEKRKKEKEKGKR